MEENSPNNLVNFFEHCIESLSREDLTKNQLLNLRAYLNYVFDLPIDLNVEEIKTTVKPLLNTISSAPSDLNRNYYFKFDKLNREVQGFSSYITENLRNYLSLLYDLHKNYDIHTTGNSKEWSEITTKKLEFQVFIKAVFKDILPKEQIEGELTPDTIFELINRVDNFSESIWENIIFTSTAIVPMLTTENQVYTEYRNYFDTHAELEQDINEKIQDAESKIDELYKNKNSKGYDLLIQKYAKQHQDFSKLQKQLALRQNLHDILKQAISYVNSPLASNYDMCRAKLVLNTFLVGQTKIKELVNIL
jgi:hypothetical protein